jgi:dTDP-4-amino-4,6-dideoxygalactose transaminase
MSIGIEERNAVLRVMDRGILSGYRGSMGDWFYGGEEIKALEKEWAAKFKVKHAIATNSATSGLWLACAAAGIKTMDYVAVVPYSMTCSASMPLHFNAKPVFIDIEDNYFCMSADDLENKLGGLNLRHYKAIIVVDLFGMPYDADRINAIAKKHNAIVIEDAAQACGATYKGRYAGTLGDIGVFSLNVHKHIQCGEGGIVVTDNDDLAMKIRLCMNHAEAVNNDLQNADYNLLVGMNLRMTELSAAVAREQLKKLDGIISKYSNMATYFPVKVRPECESAFYRYAWRNKDALLLPDIGFNIKRHYITPLFKMPLFQSLGYDQNQCPVCREVDEDIILAWPREVA